MDGHQPKWKKPTTVYRALTDDEYLIVDTTKLGLKISGQRADFKRAENDYDNRDFGWMRYRRCEAKLRAADLELPPKKDHELSRRKR